MEVLIFIIVLVVLILVHELGHFIAAKLSGMRVDEFGLGYPPRALTILKRGETEYTLNWLPFGGFVKIYGEDGGESGSRAFSSRPRILQAIVLSAGVVMNLVLAYVLITAALISGTPRALAPKEIASAHEVQLAVADVVPSSPAARAGITAGDSILSANTDTTKWESADPKSFTAFIAASNGAPMRLVILHNGVAKNIVATATRGIVATDASRYALGVQVATIGTVPVPFFAALKEGASLTWGTLMLTAAGLWHFFYGVFTFSADLSQVAGPVGIAGAVGGAAVSGFGNLLSLMAVISINLALINLLPVPALDGGRLLFVIIESITRRPINKTISQSVNAVGFAFLVLLMVVVTAHDIYKIVG